MFISKIIKNFKRKEEDEVTNKNMVIKKMKTQKKKVTNRKVAPESKKGKVTLSYEGKKEHFMDIHQSAYVSESKSNNCKRQGRSKHSLEKAKKKKKRNGRKLVELSCCFSHAMTEEQEFDNYEEEKNFENSHQKVKSPSVSLSDYIDMLTNKPPLKLKKTVSNDLPIYKPVLKRFLSYQGELDDLLLPLVPEEKTAETKNNDDNSIYFSKKTRAVVDDSEVPVTLYNTPERYFNSCSKTILNELNELKLRSIENLKETSSYYKDFVKKKERPNPKCLKRIFREIRKDLPRALEIDAYGSMFIRYDQDAPMFMKALISGGPNSPYADGLFLFDIFADNK